MDLRQAGLGVLLLILFWAFQAGYFSVLGSAAWFVAAVIFVGILMAIGKGVMKKPPAELKLIWNAATGIAVAVSLIVSFGAPYIPGIVIPSGDLNAIVTPMMLSFLLIVLGSAMFVTGHLAKDGLALMTGIIWLLSSVTWVGAAGPNAYFHFALVASLPFIVVGLLSKK